MKRFEFTIIGKVQGVSYRAFVKEKANALGVVGSVKNLPDGSVRVVAEGEPDKVEAFLAFLREGSERAKVQEIAVSESDFLGQTEGFKII